MRIVTFRTRLLLVAALSLGSLLPSACAAPRVSHPPAPWQRQSDVLTLNRAPSATGSGVDVAFDRWLSPSELDSLPDDFVGLAFALDAMTGFGARIQLLVNGVAAHALPPKAQIRGIHISRRVFGGADASVTTLNVLTR